MAHVQCIRALALLSDCPSDLRQVLQHLIELIDRLLEEGLVVLVEIADGACLHFEAVLELHLSDFLCKLVCLLLPLPGLLRFARALGPFVLHKLAGSRRLLLLGIQLRLE